MNRRLLIVLLGAFPAWASQLQAAIRGKLIPRPSPAARLLTTSRGEVALSGDPQTLSVLADERLMDADFEAIGEVVPPNGFRIDPIYKRSMFVYKDGKRLMISYWCPVCSIRTYAPGKCMCCQEETELDLKEKFSD